MKFGRSGKPHLTAVKLSDDLLSIVWSNGSKSARTSTIVDVLSGRKTKVWAIHFPNKDKEQSQQSSAAANDTHNNSNNNNSVDSFCFSIVFTDRTLDLQIDNSTLHSDAAPSTAINALNTAMQARDDYVRAFKWAHDFGCKLSAGLPMNVKKVLHVNRAMEWSGQNLEEVFELKEKLGEGAFGSVYRVVHRSAKIEMAVKLIPASNPEAMNDIKKEIEILQSCRNQYIVGYYGCWGPDSQNRLWILMDYCAVGSMVTLLHLTKAVLTEAQIAFIMHSTLTALVYLQSQQIIHRDVKGRNILVTADGDIKLADFGVSKSIKDDNGLTSSGICGSPLFMAPEVCTNKPTSFASDIWSLGITAIEIAEGRVPYDEMNSALRIMRAITNNPPPNLTQQSWSPSFRNFVSACLVKDPAKRPDAIKMLSDPFVANVKSTAHSKFVLRPLLDRFFELKAKKNASNNAAAAVAAVLAVAAAPYTAAANANALAPSAANPAPEKEKEKGYAPQRILVILPSPID